MQQASPPVTKPILTPRLMVIFLERGHGENPRPRPRLPRHPAEGQPGAVDGLSKSAVNARRIRCRIDFRPGRPLFWAIPSHGPRAEIGSGLLMPSLDCS